MATVNRDATYKFVIVLNEKSPPGKLFSATGQLAMSLFHDATDEQREEMRFAPFLNFQDQKLIQVTTCSFVVLKGSAAQLFMLYSKACEEKILSAIFTSTMSYNGVEEDLFVKTATTPLDQVEVYAVGLFGSLIEVNPLTKKFSLFK